MTYLRDWWDAVREDVADWCAEQKSWSWRVPIFLYMAFLTVNHLLTSQTHDLLSLPIAGITLAVHEAGHVIFRAFGETICVMGGSINQVIVPILLGFSFYRQRDYFAITFAGTWLCFSLLDMATYIADARAQQLQLVSLGGGGEPLHDWNYLLDQWGLLSSDLDIAACVRVVAFIVGIGSLALGAWMLYRMATTRKLEDLADSVS